MKHQEFKNRDAYARRYGELVFENVTMEKRIHRLVRDYNMVVKKLRELECKHKDVVTELAKTKAANDEMTKYFQGVCYDNIARGRETDKLRYELLILRGENENLKQERSALIDFIEEKGFTCVMNTECPHGMVETGDTFLKETPKTVKVDSIACWNCENCYCRLKDRGKIVCKECLAKKSQRNIERNKNILTNTTSK